MASPRALQDWCRYTCAPYPGVDIRNMSSSFTDGLAFCALIHRHRPDLIDFSSLCKDNAYDNNKLAFKTAETKLGIPPLLDPNDMVSTKVPDCLSVISYVSLYYCYFNRKSYGLAGSTSSHVTISNSPTKSYIQDAQKDHKSTADLETSTGGGLSSTRPHTVCPLCLKPVHLIQRHLIDGKIYHRSCFRCKLCHGTLLPGSYTQGSDTGSLICSHHSSESRSTHPDPCQRSGSTQNLKCTTSQAGFISLDGLAISSLPHYTKETDSQDGLVCKPAETELKQGQERNTQPARPPRTKAGPGVAGDALTDSGTQQELTKTCAAPGGGGRPVPAPRKMYGSSGAPLAAPRARTAAQTTSSSPAAGTSSNQSQIPTSPARGSSSSMVKTNHPWLTIVHPGPWTQLPPAAAPVPPPRRTWHRPRVTAPNPFAEDIDEEAEDDGVKLEATDSVEALQMEICPGETGDQSGVTNKVDSSDDAAASDVTEEVAAAAGLHSTSDEANTHILPRSMSVPVVTDANQCAEVASSQSKLACKENPFDRKPAMPKSQTFQALTSRRASAPGHGFPLIKRKVQTDQNISMENLQAESREVEERLEALEQRGVDLERKLRDCKNGTDEEQMLMEWFSLVQEKHCLVRRNTELVNLMKQQSLEERQADVEYGLRCLLNKPESDWSSEDRGQERRLMSELVAIIEQRNQIISSFEEDRQREREEDMFFEAMLKNKELQKEGFKELKKSKGKFKPAKVFKMLHQKAESSKDSMNKKN